MWMYETLIERPLTQSQRRCMQLSWLFLWHMPEGVAEHSFLRLQPSGKLHIQLKPLCSAVLVPNVLPRRDEGSGKPGAYQSLIVY